VRSEGELGQACWRGTRGGGLSYLVKRLCIEQDPADLNHLGRVLGDVHTMLVAGGRNVDDDVAVDLERRGLGGSHGDGGWYVFGTGCCG